MEIADGDNDDNHEVEVEHDDGEVEMVEVAIRNNVQPRQLSPESERRINCLLRAAEEALQDLDSEGIIAEEPPAKYKPGRVRRNRSPLFVPLDTSGGTSATRPALLERSHAPELQMGEKPSHRSQIQEASPLKRKTKAASVPPSFKTSSVTSTRPDRKAQLWNPQDPPEPMEISDDSSDDDQPLSKKLAKGAISQNN